MEEEPIPQRQLKAPKSAPVKGGKAKIGRSEAVMLKEPIEGSPPPEQTSNENVILNNVRSTSIWPIQSGRDI